MAYTHALPSPSQHQILPRAHPRVLGGQRPLRRVTSQTLYRSARLYDVQHVARPTRTMN